MQFEWDESKNRLNQRKHGVSFEEAQTVFFDPLAKVADDPDHSSNESRLILVGHSSRRRCLLVVHCLKESETIVRLISARKLTRSEQRSFEEGL